MNQVMRVVPLALLFALACATTGGNATEPEIRVQQFPQSEFVARQEGAVSISYQLVVHNRSSEPIRLKRLDMQTLGRSPYTLRKTPVTFDQAIAPGKEESVTFSMWAVPQESESGTARLVTVHGIASFENASGSFQKEFTQSFREPAASQ